MSEYERLRNWEMNSLLSSYGLAPGDHVGLTIVSYRECMWSNRAVSDFCSCGNAQHKEATISSRLAGMVNESSGDTKENIDEWGAVWILLRMPSCSSR